MAENPGKMYALATVLALLANVAVMLRLYARRKTKQSISWDDYLVLLALVSTSVSFSAMISRAKGKFRSSRLGRQSAC
jgi:membrane-associated HD superfamily phosphohydrolase